MAFRWDKDLRRYRDADSGRFLAEAKVRALRQDLIDRATAEVDALAAQLADGTITTAEWTTSMRETVKRLTIDQYLLGRGGRNAMTQADWGRIGYRLREQYGYLQRFAELIDQGQLSDAQIAARAKLYVGATWSTFDRAKAAAWQIVLPAHPGDGGTRCRSACRCHWDIRRDDEAGVIKASWVLDSAAEHCEDCRRRAREWAPLEFPIVTYPDGVDPETGLYSPAA